MRKPALFMPALLIGMLLVISLAACSQPTPEPTATATLTQSPTVTPTATATSTPTQTPTVTPTPTLTFTPSPVPPSATPAGYFVDHKTGYSIILPSSWEAMDNNGATTFIDTNAGIILIVGSEPASETKTALEIAQTFKEMLFAEMTAEYSEPFQVEGPNGATMDAVDLTVTADDGDVIWRTIVHFTEGQFYIISVLGQPDNLASRESTLERMVKSMEFFTPSLFGTTADETLNQLGGDPDETDLDPALSLAGAGGYAGLLYSGLVRLTPDLQIVPDLAESWVISPDGTIYTFTLRPDLHFADGKPLTAEDVRLSWERTADPATKSSTAKTYMGDILGFNEKLAGEADTISGVRVIDDRTLEVTLDGPKPYFLAKLTYPTSYVVDTRQTDDDIWMWSPNASGAYTFKDYLEQDGILLERNEQYHTPPAIRYLVFDLNAGGSPISLYESNRLDIIGLDSETTIRVRDPQDELHGEWVSAPSLCTSFVQMNNTLPPFDDINVRKAFLLATDPQVLVENLTQNTDLVAQTILPPGMPGFSGDLSTPGFDPEAARDALAASQYAGDLPPIILNASGYGDDQRDDVAILAEMWKTNLGIEIEVKYLDPQDFTRAARENHDHLVIYGWCADYPDPENFLDVLYHTDSEMNAAGYTNPEIDVLLEQARTELDPVKRLQLYHDAEMMLLADAATIPLSHNVWDALVKPYVQGFILSPSSTAAEMWLSLIDLDE